jgi:hypothetical protein
MVGQTYKYEIQLAIAQSNFGTINSAGYSNTHSSVEYGSFSNVIYIGAFSDSAPNSFQGMIKEFKLFTKYHGLAQMQDEVIRLYRLFSYDEKELVAYWKLSDGYTSSNLVYTIQDYS